MPITNIPEHYDSVSFLAQTAVTKNRVVIGGTVGVSDGTTKSGAVRTPLSAASSSLCFAGYAEGSAAAAGNLVPIRLEPEYIPAGTADLGTSKGTEIPKGVTLTTESANAEVLVAINGIVKVEASGAIKIGDRVGVSGTDGRIAAA